MSLPPAARVAPVRETLHGVAVEDPYRWMEAQDAEFDAWLDAEAAHAARELSALPGRAGIHARLRELSAGAGSTRHGLVAAGGRLFDLRADAGGAPVLAVDGAVLFAPGADSLDWYVPSPDGTLVACGLSGGGSERSALRILSVATGRLLPDRIDDVWHPYVSWLGDGSLLYHRYPHAAAGRRDLSATRRHRLGDDPAADPVVLGPDAHPGVPLAPTDRPLLMVPPGGAWALALVAHGALGGGGIDERLRDCTLYAAPVAALDDPATCPWRRVAAREDETVAFALGPDAAYLVVAADAPRRRVLRVPFGGGPVTEVVPQGPRVIEAVRVVDDRLLVRDLDGGVSRLRRVPLDGGPAEEVPMPVEGGLREWASLPDGGPALLVGTWTAPAAWYRYDPATGTLAPEEVAEGPGDLTFHRVVVTARDGTEVPVSLIHRADLVPDGERPVWLTGYGSYGIVLSPAHEPHRRVWFERGGVWAVAHLRGGGEHGRDWHRAGRLLTKENTVTDLIDCATGLIDAGWTRPGRLVACGGSAGGIPVGGALVRRPDLWGAVVLNVPLLDSLRFEFSENGPVNVPELGTVGTPDGLRALLISDTYRRLRDGVAYPPVLVTAGRNDSRLPPWQPGKFVARLRATGTAAPVLLRVDAAGGHGPGATTAQRDAELADTYAFVLDALGIDA
ncbi:prolyl oligopeptidase [Virgisporangium aliadipatigenens]|uniref:Prolyl oligopeptidase n=1 Tax=Virgisporangium aliadipatigenens TaxID=741659 RepID=A0A8J3YFP5_9ACTN|nr:prolyl oligopeptidase family serine peptidase [Virgisporangium aliadipatigenens]GIJ44314.1 prolyl oligopeptidase [Virgisporangium aliadipatigenens]